MIGLQGLFRQPRIVKLWDSLWLLSVSKQRFAEERERSIRMGWILGLLSIIPDIIVTILTQSVTMLTDVFRTGTDTLASFLSWLTVRKIARGHTAKYNYGYGKLEGLAGLAVAATMMVSFLIIVFSAIGRLHDPVSVQRITYGVAFTTIAGMVNGCCWIRNRRLAKREPSPVMESQWRLFRAKTAINLCVFLSLVLTATLQHQYRWAIYIDPIASLILASFLLFSAYQIVSVSVYDLLDRSVEESLELIIHNGLEEHAGHYAAFHGIRSRKSGGHMYIELFLEFAGDARMAQVQQAIDRIQHSLEAKVPGSHVMIVPATKAVTRP